MKWQCATSLSALAAAFCVSATAGLATVAAAPAADSRALITGRALRGRELGWFDDVSKAVTNVGKDTAASGSKYVVIGGNKLKDGAIGVTQEAVSYCEKTVEILGGSPLARDAKVWSVMSSGAAEDAWGYVLKGAGAVSTYVDKHLVTDLMWIGDQLGAFACSVPGLQEAQLKTCTIGLNAGNCINTFGMGPHCANQIDTNAVTTITSVINETAFDSVMSCSVYHVLKRTGMCSGLAYSLGLQLATLIIAEPATDPYASVCKLSLTCVCEPTTCPFTCNQKVPAYCDSSTFKTDSKRIGDAITTISTAKMPTPHPAFQPVVG
jgi:hypothetical protein